MQMMVRRGDATLEIMATLETRPGANRPYSFSLGGQAVNVQDQQGSKGFEYGGVYRSDDAGETWTRVNSLNSRPMYFSQIRVDPSDDQRVYVLGVAQYQSANGGLTFEPDFGKGVHADGHALWIDPRDGRHMLIGTDGGLYVTYDRGANWDHLNHAAIGQFYHVAIARKQPYQVTGGLQDNGTWLGPSLSKSGGGPINEDWIAVGGSDGFMCRVDPEDPDLVYFTAQNGVMSRRNLRTGQSAPIRPQRPKGAPSYRFNWNTPFILSQHNSQIFWCAGNYVFRSIHRGDNLQVMSPEITLTKRGSSTALAESPRNPDVLYVGTDDGARVGHARRRPPVAGRHQADRSAAAAALGGDDRAVHDSRKAVFTWPSTPIARTTTIRTCSSPKTLARRGNRCAPTFPGARRVACARICAIPACCTSGPSSPLGARSIAVRLGTR